MVWHAMKREWKVATASRVTEHASGPLTAAMIDFRTAEITWILQNVDVEGIEYIFVYLDGSFPRCSSVHGRLIDRVWRFVPSNAHT